MPSPWARQRFANQDGADVRSIDPECCERAIIGIDAVSDHFDMAAAQKIGKPMFRPLRELALKGTASLDFGSVNLFEPDPFRPRTPANTERVAIPDPQLCLFADRRAEKDRNDDVCIHF